MVLSQSNTYFSYSTISERGKICMEGYPTLLRERFLEDDFCLSIKVIGKWFCFLSWNLGIIPKLSCIGLYASCFLDQGPRPFWDLKHFAGYQVFLGLSNTLSYASFDQKGEFLTIEFRKWAWTNSFGFSSQLFWSLGSKNKPWISVYNWNILPCCTS